MCSSDLFEAPVGFKWFAPGLLDGSLGFGGEESAGASFLRRDGHVWTTDKDGIAAALLSAEITACTGRDPGVLYRELCTEFGEFVADRIDAPADQSDRNRRRAHHQRNRQGAWQRSAPRRHKGQHAKWLVRRAAIGHRRHLQDIRGELS